MKQRFPEDDGKPLRQKRQTVTQLRCPRCGRVYWDANRPAVHKRKDGMLEAVCTSCRTILLVLVPGSNRDLPGQMLLPGIMDDNDSPTSP